MSDFNAEELEATKWLNADFLTKVLRQYENNKEIVLDSFKRIPATAKGEHYSSVMFRVALNYQKQNEMQTKSIIIKVMPDVEGDNEKMDMLMESKLFETEIGMYTEVIPKFEQILREVGDDTKLGANCLYHSLTPRKLIIFEDIVPLGFWMLPQRYADMTETKAALLKLAKWHAISYKLNLENPTYFEKYRHGVMNNDRLTAMDYMTTGITHFVEMLDTVPTLQAYKPYFEKIKPDLLKNCKAIFNECHNNPPQHSHYVLCHGDFHSKNIMFKNDAETGQLLDVMLLDFQICYMGPMVNDLLFAIYLLVNAELRLQHFDEILYYYFDNFLETLKKIGFEGSLPTLLEFRKQLLQYKYWDFFLLTTFLPLAYDFQDGTVDVNQLLGAGDFRKNFYRNKRYIDELHILLPKLLHLGYFDD